MKELADKKIIALVMIIMIISGFFVYKYIWPKYNRIVPEINTYNIDKPSPKSEKVTSKKTSTKERKEYKPDCCILRKKISDKEDIIFDNENCNLEIIKWKDYLIFPQGNGYKEEDVVLYAYNIKTSEKIKIYSLNEHSSDYARRRPFDIYLGEIFDDTLFFDAGGYMTDQVLYSLDLSNIKSEPKLIAKDNLYSKIEYSDGHYWITGGFGDAGVSASKRALFDVKKQKIVGQAIGTSEELGVGTRYIGADESRAFIALFEDVSNLHLSEIYSLDLMKKKDQKTIISKKKMPSNIFRAVYMYDKKKIVLLGDDAYTYDLEEEKLKKIISLKDVKLGWLNTVSGDTICIAEKLKLDVEKKTLVTDETDCVHKSSVLEVKMSEKIKNFNLPPEYFFEYVEEERS